MIFRSLSDAYKRKMNCRNIECFRVKTRRKVHFHCLFCKTYSYHDFKRVITHMLKCSMGRSFVAVAPSQGQKQSNDPAPGPVSSVGSTTGSQSNPVTLSTSPDCAENTTVGKSNVQDDGNSSANGLDTDDSSKETLVGGTAVRVCWDRSTTCVVRSARPQTKHFHCSICDKSDASLPRIQEHFDKCKIRKESSVAREKSCSISHSKPLLQAELICANTGTYLVRRSTQGPASPVHVVHSKTGWECSAPLCQDFYNFHSGSLNPGFMCDHVLACVNRNLTVQADLIQNVSSYDAFGADDKDLILAFCKTANDFGLPIIKQYNPTMVDASSTSRYIYYSVFAGDERPKYYSKLGRVLVTVDRVNKTHKCDCGIKSCIHRKVAVLVSETNPLVNESRPEDDTDEKELKFAEQMMEYVMQHKRIPFDVSKYRQPVPKSEFAPTETQCHKCDNVDLVTRDVSNRGCIFTLNEKKTGIKVVTKACPSCSMQYRYAEYSEGYFNFNNNSFFSVSLMEVALAAWINNTSLTAFFDIMKVATDQKYNIHILLDAVKSYMALKDFQLDDNLNCYRCGHFPVYLTYDVIRNVCFDVKPGDVTNHEYDSSSAMHSNCSQYNLSRSYLDKKSPHYNKNVEHFSVKLGQTLPPVVSSKNFSSIDPYTRPHISNDKAEEIRLPLERIEQLVNSTNSYKQLKDICKSLNIETRGGKAHMVARLIDLEGNTQLYSVVRKNFTKLSGKSGGVLRAFCPHGVCYGLKFLTLPESVADYTNLITSFQVQPSFNMSDIATLWGNHLERHHPGFARPDRGRLASPDDPKSEMYKDGRKTAVFNHNTFTTCKLDIDNYDHYSVHPISLLSSVLFLFDIFHESNQNLIDTYLRSVKCTNLAPYLNTSVAEQQNHVLALTKSFCNEMSPEQHILFVSYLTSVHNNKINEEWKRRVEKNLGESCVVDELGFLVRTGVDKSSSNSTRFDTPPTGDLTSPHPLPILQDPSNDSSALNSVVYALSLSHVAEAVLNDEKCLGHELVSFVCGKAPYSQLTHFRMKKKIDKQIMDAGGSTDDPCSIFATSFLPDLKKHDVLLAESRTSSLNMGIGLDVCLQSQSSVVDYVILTKPDATKFFNGVRPHFNVTYCDTELRFDTVAYISKTSPSVYSSFARIGDQYYEMCNTKSNLLSEHAFLEFARSSCLVIFKLSTPVSAQSQTTACNKCTSARPSTDVFDFEPASSFKRKAPMQAPIKRKKTKIGSGHSVQSIPNNWLTFSDTGRLALYTEQYRICQSASAWYDDIIINAYAFMCKRYRSDSFVFQDTCLGSPYSINGFNSVDHKFIQIINPGNVHWFCVSNALTFRNEPHIVEVFDSLQTGTSLEKVVTVDSSITRLILQLRPSTSVIRYVETQVQGNGYDCGPMALAFLWALSMGHHPRQYEHLRGPMIRSKVRQSFIHNRFIPPCSTSPRMHHKRVLKTFHLDTSSKTFVQQL